MKIKKPIVLIPLFVLNVMLISSAFAQEPTFKLSGQVRQRTELSGKDFADSTKVATATAQRTRLNLSFTTGAGDHAFLQIQDTRNYGSETSTLSDGSADNLDIHQAFYQVNGIGGQPLSAKVGRQEVAFGNQRLVGAVGWHNIARSFDGARFSYGKNQFKVDAFWMKEVEQGAAGNVGDKDFRGIWLDSQWNIPGLVNSTNLDAFFLNQKSQKQDDALSINTMGIFSKGSYGLVGGIKVTQEFDFAIQSGSKDDTTDVSASLLAVRLGFVLGKMSIKPTVGFGYDLVSGDDATTPEYEAFNTLYATNHKFYGFMDYFLNVPVHAKGYGLQDILVTAGIAPLKGANLKFAYHILSTPEPVTIDGAEQTDIGTEIDLTADYVFRPGFKIVVGHSIFSPGPVFEEWKGTDSAAWSYLMTIFNF